jgi:hypothetical protein
MNIQVPLVLFAVGISLYYFNSINRRNRLVKAERKEMRNEIKQRRQQIVDLTIALKKEQDTNTKDKTESNN